MRVVPISLGEIYKLMQKDRTKPDFLEFAYVPMQQQVTAALTILKQSDPKATQFSGVPLFVARGGPPERGSLTIQQGNQQVIPLFFSKEELQTMLERFKQQQPNLAASVDIQVLNLEGVLQTLKSGTSPQLNQLLLIPPRDSLEYVRSLNPGGAGQPQPPKPAPKPTPATTP